MNINNHQRLKIFYRASELSEALGISLSTMWRWRKSGAFPEPIQLGPRIIAWKVEDINKWLNSQGV